MADGGDMTIIRELWRMARRRWGAWRHWPLARMFPQYECGADGYGNPRICDFSYGAARLRIGNRVIMAQGVVILMGPNHIRGTWPPEHEATGDVVIGDDVWLGYGALLVGCRGLTIGDGAIVGAGAVVARDVAAGATVVGNPARQVGAKGA